MTSQRATDDRRADLMRGAQLIAVKLPDDRDTWRMVLALAWHALLARLGLREIEDRINDPPDWNEVTPEAKRLALEICAGLPNNTDDANFILKETARLADWVEGVPLAVA